MRAAPAEKLLLVLRDGRKIIGTMRSFDQFSNIVLEHAEERVVVGKRFADVPLGLYVIRGENLVLLGQIVRACDARAREPGPHRLTPPRAPARRRTMPRRRRPSARSSRGAPHDPRRPPARPPLPRPRAHHGARLLADARARVPRAPE